MIICCTYYSYMFFVINEDDISSRKNDLVHAAARFDAVASETVRLADSLVSKAEVNKFKNMTDVMAYPNTYKINELRDIPCQICTMIIRKCITILFSLIIQKW